MDTHRAAVESALTLAALLDQPIGIAVVDASGRCVSSSRSEHASPVLEASAREAAEDAAHSQSPAFPYTVAVRALIPETEQVCTTRALEILRGSTDTRQSLDGALLRQVMGSFVTGVVVIITRDIDKDRPVGMTATGLVSLSLAPPLIGLSVGSGASSHPAFVRSTDFTISVLHSEQSELARQLAKSGPDKFLGVDLVDTPAGGWVLADASTTLSCLTRGTLTTGDHTLIVGEVYDAQQIDNAPALLFFGGGKFGYPEMHKIHMTH